MCTHTHMCVQYVCTGCVYVCMVTYLAQVRFPELQVAARDESSAYRIVKDILDAKLVEDAGLVVRDPQLLGHLSAALWWQDVSWFYRPMKTDGVDQGRPSHSQCQYSLLISDCFIAIGTAGDREVEQVVLFGPSFS